MLPDQPYSEKEDKDWVVNKYCAAERVESMVQQA
jgi:hypothetical protein